MTPSIAHLKTLAEKATPGNWYKDRDFPEVKVSHVEFIAVVPGNNKNCQEDAEFISAANSATVLKLIALLEGCREAMDIISINGYCSHCDNGMEEMPCTCFDFSPSECARDMLARLDGEMGDGNS